jgi:3-isopropylmalate dehydrogenase
VSVSIDTFDQEVTVAALLGDDIGPDIVRSTMDVMKEACELQGVSLGFEILPSGLAALDSHGSTLPLETRDALESYRGWILGPVTHHMYEGGTGSQLNPSGYLRKNYELYANVRPARSLPGVPSLRDDIDLVVVRENTEGFYADRCVLDGNGEFRIDVDTVVSVRVVTRRASLRVARYAFELARARGGKKKVTAVHKANVLRRGDGLFLEAVEEIASEYPDVELETYHVDAFAMYLVMRPQTFDVIVTTNLFGDILSDEAAGLVGGLGLAAGLNVGVEHAMAQATHGSAPDISHLHVANPTAEILSGGMLLQWLAVEENRPALALAGQAVHRSVHSVLEEHRFVTPDLGGSANTQQMTERIISQLSN